jgi:hypothetical protein
MDCRADDVSRVFRWASSACSLYSWDTVSELTGWLARGALTGLSWARWDPPDLPCRRILVDALVELYLSLSPATHRIVPAARRVGGNFLLGNIFCGPSDVAFYFTHLSTQRSARMACVPMTRATRVIMATVAGGRRYDDYRGWDDYRWVLPLPHF